MHSLTSSANAVLAPGPLCWWPCRLGSAAGAYSILSNVILEDGTPFVESFPLRYLDIRRVFPAMVGEIMKKWRRDGLKVAESLFKAFKITKTEGILSERYPRTLLMTFYFLFFSRTRSPWMRPAPSLSWPPPPCCSWTGSSGSAPSSCGSRSTSRRSCPTTRPPPPTASSSWRRWD